MQLQGSVHVWQRYIGETKGKCFSGLKREEKNDNEEQQREASSHLRETAAPTVLQAQPNHCRSSAIIYPACSTLTGAGTQGSFIRLHLHREPSFLDSGLHFLRTLRLFCSYCSWSVHDVSPLCESLSLGRADLLPCGVTVGCKM